ncbi:hypothetical protein MIND_00880800 [Mycena indigotica]|uniref:U6 snRNA phosphodiesterase n=1 Tax=Mycena indigotica TaxID=2126181 RepID=A0A8H6SI11_9AGAR|nr:uncharacterized protein MIND_00880800 [Mycena indigotica]KAF7299318.1 hypothetical protein MIND_00880800 [Mycena indigotica]
MKRDAVAASLVAYSDSESDVEKPSPEPPPPPAKKRKLPTLSNTLSGPKHIDDPSQHQGRTRSTPHVDGQWATHIYAHVLPDSTFVKLVQHIIDAARTVVPSLHSLVSPGQGEDGPSEQEPELHVSLSRPIFLRAEQREEFRNEVRKIAAGTSRFAASFARISSLTNDDNTRIFLVLEIGAGHPELSAFTNALTPLLQTIRQKEYYASPRFHASIGWALETTPTGSKISAFPETLLPMLNERYSARLSATSSMCDIAEVGVRIGKMVTLCPLQ